MRKISLIATTALLAGGFGVAVAQVAPNNRPMNVGVSPQTMQAAGNTNVYQAQIDQLKAQVAALKLELASVRKDLGTVSSIDTQRINKLDADLKGHNHMYFFVDTANGKTEKSFVTTSVPSVACKSITPNAMSSNPGAVAFGGAFTSPYVCNK